MQTAILGFRRWKYHVVLFSSFAKCLYVSVSVNKFLSRRADVQDKVEDVPSKVYIIAEQLP